MLIDSPVVRPTIRRCWRADGFRVALMALLLALGFLGSRGIWDPDEGRYSNVALNMLDSGDWLHPMRNSDTGHWTKPPLTYWAVASSVAVFGRNAWAARLPQALGYLLCALLAARLARRLAPGAEAATAAIYATMVMPFAASQTITTDFLLAACQALAMLGFVEARFAPAQPGESRRRWIVLLWAALALGFLAKGPPALIVLLPMFAFDRLLPARTGGHLFHGFGLLVFPVIALPWFLIVIRDDPALLSYFVGHEVVNRVTTDRFGRHGEWYGWIKIYLPTLLVGTLPWTWRFWPWLRDLPHAVRRWRDRSQRLDPALLLALWLLLPLLVFCLARSRLPLYLLPLFVPLALLVARERARRSLGMPPWPWLSAWAALLLCFKFGLAQWPSDQDARAWAAAVYARNGGAPAEVTFVDDTPRYGLNLELGAQVERVSLYPLSRPQPINPDYDEELLTELREREPAVLWICKARRWPEIERMIAAAGYRTEALGTPYHGRVMFRVISPPQG